MLFRSSAAKKQDKTRGLIAKVNSETVVKRDFSHKKATVKVALF